MNSQPKNYNSTEPVRAVPVTTVEGRYNDIVLNVGEDNISNKMKITYSLSKTVKCLALIDICFSVLYAFYNFWYFLPLLFGYFGYVGASQFKKNYISIYLCYNICNILSRFIFIIMFAYAYLQGSLNIKESQFSLNIIFSILCILLEFWILKVIHKFRNYLSDLSESELNRLQDLKIAYQVVYY
jgi:hypothetical protein